MVSTHLDDCLIHFYTIICDEHVLLICTVLLTYLSPIQFLYLMDILFHSLNHSFIFMYLFMSFIFSFYFLGYYLGLYVTFNCVAFRLVC